MIAQFALRLVCGISLFWIVIPRKKITAGFFRIQMIIAMALSALAAIAMGTFLFQAEPPILSDKTARIMAGVMSATAYCGSVMWTLNRRAAGTFCIFAVAILSLVTLLGSSLSRPMLASQMGLLTAISEVSAALLVGSATAGMLLGHWYLTATTMSIEPLNRANGCFAIASLFRLVTAAWALSLLETKIAVPPLGVWLSLHWIAGIFGPLVLSLMVWRILKLRNTQAATGVLFVGVIVVFIGELSATLASRELHIPL